MMTQRERDQRADLIEIASEGCDNAATAVAVLLGAALALHSAAIGAGFAVTTIRGLLDDIAAGVHH